MTIFTFLPRDALSRDVL